MILLYHITLFEMFIECMTLAIGALGGAILGCKLYYKAIQKYDSNDLFSMIFPMLMLICGAFVSMFILSLFMELK